MPIITIKSRRRGIMMNRITKYIGLIQYYTLALIGSCYKLERYLDIIFYFNNILPTNDIELKADFIALITRIPALYDLSYILCVSIIRGADSVLYNEIDSIQVIQQL